jgi:hypothetical protein
MDVGTFTEKCRVLEGFHAKQSLRTFGTGEHPRHHFSVVHIALSRGCQDTFECVHPEHAWPPLGLRPGDPIVASGKWSFDRTLAGGIAAGGGPLHIVGCLVSRRGESPSKPER